jgi:hypothetical protein
VPELWPDLIYVYNAHARLGRDANGRSLQTDQLAWLEAECVTDRGERDGYREMFAAIDDEYAVMAGERQEKCLGCDKACWRPWRPDGTRKCHLCGKTMTR